MITTVSLVNMHHLELLHIFFLWWELLRSTLSNFQIDDTVLLARVTMPYITSPGLIYVKTGRTAGIFEESWTEMVGL